MQPPQCSPRLVPHLPECEHTARVFNPDPAPSTRVLGEGPAAGVHRLVRAVQVRLQSVPRGILANPGPANPGWQKKMGKQLAQKYLHKGVLITKLMMVW